MAFPEIGNHFARWIDRKARLGGKSEVCLKVLWHRLREEQAEVPQKALTGVFLIFSFFSSSRGHFWRQPHAPPWRMRGQALANWVREDAAVVSGKLADVQSKR